MKTLNTAHARLMKGGIDELKRWFGDGSDAWRKDARAKVGIMKMHLNCTYITCVVGKDLSTAHNAEAMNWGAGMLKGDGMNTAQKATKLKQEQNAGVDDLKIGPNFPNLPKYGTKPFTTGQTQFETLVHELSHLFIGTKDEDVSAGTKAYCADNALELVKNDAAKAKTNAENWGFFIEEFRS